MARQASREIERLAEGRFYGACVGQFKRDKSNLINALVGHAASSRGRPRYVRRHGRPVRI